MEQKITRFVWNHKRLQIAKVILRKKNVAGSSTLAGFKLYYKATIIKTAWYWQNNSHTHQWNRIESTKIKVHVYGQNVFDKWTKNTQSREKSFFNKRCWENWEATCKELHYNLPLHTKINSKWIEDLNIRPNTINYTE